jgi:hypothetical protein
VFRISDPIRNTETSPLFFQKRLLLFKKIKFPAFYIFPRENNKNGGQFRLTKSICMIYIILMVSMIMRIG